MGNKIDRSFRILITISIVGIIGSLIALKFLMDQRGQQVKGDKVAEITLYNLDTRLKRSGDIHWYQVHEKIDCYENDRIFTGKDSYAKIRFLSGATVSIQPQSLISLSKNLITLSTGTIELDLNQGTLEVEAQGERIAPEPKTKFRLENKEGVKKVWQLEGKEDKVVKKIFQDTPTPVIPELFILSPGFGEKIPKLPATPRDITFSWRSGVKTATNFRIDFSTSETFARTVLSKSSSASMISIPDTEFPEGMMFWKVTDEKNNQTAVGSFFLAKDKGLELVSPKSATYPLALAQEGLSFQWNNNYDTTQRLQVSMDQNFSKISHQSDLNGNKALVKLNQIGDYYWRVGQVFDGETFWSVTQNFSIQQQADVPPLEFLNLPEQMDFSLNDKYSVEVSDLNICDTVELLILQQTKLKRTLTSDDRIFSVLRLDEGNYDAKIRCLKDGKEFDSEPKKFTVKNSAPVPPPPPIPKVKNRKRVKVFVYLNTILDFIFPSAHAQTRQFYVLSWEGIDNALYEVEVYSDKNERIVKTQTNKTEYRFELPGLGQYTWQVRSKVNGTWGKFSERFSINVQDKITNITAPLMVSPPDQTTITPSSQKSEIEFTWTEPSPDFEYFLEIYKTSSSETPMKVFPVRGGKYKLKLKAAPKEFYWRVFARSKYKNQSPDSSIYRIAFDREKIQKPLRYDLFGGLAVQQTSFSQNIGQSGTTTLPQKGDFQGIRAEYGAEYFFRRWAHNRTLRFTGSNAMLSKGSDKFTDTKLNLDFGWVSNPTHRFYVGYMLNHVDLTLGIINSMYSQHFLGGRYIYHRQMNEKLWLDFNFGLQSTIGYPYPSVTFRPVLSYQYSKKLVLSTMAFFEKYKTKPALSSSDVSGNFEVDVTNIGLGVGAVWSIQ